ncbi:MAG: PAS domain S-box protein, partial [Candidatus Omnitrophica bacterium]|nr:PAS domain S-box protein [Candidatus Omnitrophota bacterium]
SLERKEKSGDFEEGVVRDASGTDRAVLWRNSPLKDPHGNVIGIVRAGTDITDQITISRQNRILVSAIESMAESIEITDKEGNIQYVNPAFERTSGYSRDEVLGRNPRFLKSGKHSKKFYSDMWKTLQSGYVWTGEFLNRRKDGTLYREEATISPVRDRDGEIASYIAVKRDLTKEIELKTRVNQLQRMQAVGLLAAGIAHDFNNILQAILGYSSLIKERLPEGSELIEHSDRVLEGSRRGADLVRQLLTFSRQTAMKMSPIHLEIVVKEAIKLLRSTIPSPISLVFEQPGDLPMVNADPSQIHQVMVNICVNSRDAMPDGGTISVSLQTEKVGGQRIIEEDCEEGEYLVLTINDNGPGIPNENVAKVFDPFFTTKSEGHGTGLGLSTCFGIVKQHGGFIEVESQEGQGTTFSVYLPALEKEETERPATPETRTIAPKCHGRILVVDDEPYILDIAARTLRKVGFE